MADLKEVFELFAQDKKKSKVPVGDVGSIIRGLGYCPTEKELQAGISASGASGEASFDQVQKVFNSVQHTKKTDKTMADFKEALNFFDKDGGEMVVVSELSHVLTDFAEKLKTEDVDEVFRQADVDGFGQIHISEFAAMIETETS